MPDGNDARTVKVIEGLGHISAEAWDACAGTANPFQTHAFLSALEESGSATGDTGWLPRHLVVEDETGSVVAVTPLYVKNHSYGEYVFDWGWADAYERAGGRYYPKLQCAVPFTPVPGSRLMVRPDLPDGTRTQLKKTLLAGIAAVAEQLKLSSAHVTFCDEDEWALGPEQGFLQRIGQQFHWENDGYGSFDDFLGALSSRKRKAIRKERRVVAESGLDIRVLSGTEIEARHWDAFYRFYLSTTDKKWGSNYLHPEFFHLLGERLGERVALVMAFRDDRPIAGALNLIGDDCLYGRNWGAVEEHEFLHFECCYYQAIEFAIRRGLKRVEAGAQGPHKVQRGYLPARTYSLHWIRDPGLEAAVADFVRREQRGVDREMTAIAREHSPYRSTDDA